MIQVVLLSPLRYLSKTVFTVSYLAFLFVLLPLVVLSGDETWCLPLLSLRHLHHHTNALLYWVYPRQMCVIHMAVMCPRLLQQPADHS